MCETYRCLVLVREGLWQVLRIVFHVCQHCGTAYCASGTLHVDRGWFDLRRYIRFS